MKLYTAFIPCEFNHGNCASAIVQIAPLPNVNFVVSVYNFCYGLKNNVTAMISCDIGSITRDEFFSLERWKTDINVDCEKELLEVLANPEFCKEILFSMAHHVGAIMDKSVSPDPFEINRN